MRYEKDAKVSVNQLNLDMLVADHDTQRLIYQLRGNNC